jgi:hypothetical protein
MSTIDSILDALRRLFTGGGAPQPSTPPVPPAPMPPPAPLPPSDALTPLTPRVLVIVFDPVVDAASRLHLVEQQVAQRGWHRVDDLLAGYIRDVDECSGGLVKYQIVGRIISEQFPVKEKEHFRYDAARYLNVLANTAPAFSPDGCDYRAIVDEFKLLERRANNEFDEVWMFGGPFFGFFESRMVGANAFWCNSPPLENTTGKRFVIMGFNYERGIGEMLEDLGHRAESVLSRLFGVFDFVQWAYDEQRDPAQFKPLELAAANLFARYCLFDQIAPNNAHVGLLHFAPNSVRNYDWGNPRQVLSQCADWLNFPNFQSVVKSVNCSEWNTPVSSQPDSRPHHRWWFQHLPKVAGSSNGIANNWWRYFIDVTDPVFDH